MFAVWCGVWCVMSACMCMNGSGSRPGFCGSHCNTHTKSTDVEGGQQEMLLLLLVVALCYCGHIGNT